MQREDVQSVGLGDDDDPSSQISAQTDRLPLTERGLIPSAILAALVLPLAALWEVARRRR